MSWWRLPAWLMAGVMLTAACSPSPEARPPAPVNDSTTPVEGRSALDDPRHPDFPKPLIDPDDLVSGGPPPDGIPPIDDPKFAPVTEIDWLDDDEPVLSLTVRGETRAYPLQVGPGTRSSTTPSGTPRWP